MDPVGTGTPQEPLLRDYEPVSHWLKNCFTLLENSNGWKTSRWILSIDMLVFRQGNALLRVEKMCWYIALKRNSCQNEVEIGGFDWPSEREQLCCTDSMEFSNRNTRMSIELKRSVVVLTDLKDICQHGCMSTKYGWKFLKKCLKQHHLNTQLNNPLHPWKLTWQWQSNHLNMYLTFKLGIFHCHVRSGGRSFHCVKKITIPPSFFAPATPIFLQNQSAPSIGATYSNHLGHQGILTKNSVGGFKCLLCSPRFVWEMIQFDEHIFSNGLGFNNHQL